MWVQYFPYIIILYTANLISVDLITYPSDLTLENEIGFVLSNLREMFNKMKAKG